MRVPAAKLTGYDELAIWGGHPAFESPLHVGRPNIGDRVDLSQGQGVMLTIDSGTAPVPEPEIYAMMGLGLGLMGWVGRRRRQQAA